MKAGGVPANGLAWWGFAACLWYRRTAVMGVIALWLQPIVRQVEARCPCMVGTRSSRYFTGLWIHFTVSDRFAPEERQNRKMMQCVKLHCCLI